MTSVDREIIEPRSRPTGWKQWLPIGLALLAMYVPLYFRMATTLWSRAEQLYEPLVLAVSVFAFWHHRTLLREPPLTRTQSTTGWLFLSSGLALYAIGWSQRIFIFSVGSQIPVLMGTILITRGMPALRSLWFPILFLFFMVPLPSFVVSTLTAPLKLHVADSAEQILYLLHYPIARNGVVLTIGAYQLFVANACAGLHSIFSLLAAGFLYIYLTRHYSNLRNLLIVSTILPIAFFSNIIRVVVIALITYYMGDRAGQGFLHGFAGVFLFIVAVLCLFSIDLFIGLFFPDSSSKVTT